MHCTALVIVLLKCGGVFMCNVDTILSTVVIVISPIAPCSVEEYLLFEWSPVQRYCGIDHYNFVLSGLREKDMINMMAEHFQNAVILSH